MTRPFTSALGTREAVAVAQAGFVPIRQVMGAAFFQVGEPQTYGYRSARVKRAHGVVGLAIERSQKRRDTDAGAGQHHDLEVTIHTLGTAIVTLRHDPPAPPSLSTILPLS